MNSMKLMAKDKIKAGIKNFTFIKTFFIEVIITFFVIVAEKCVGDGCAIICI